MRPVMEAQKAAEFAGAKKVMSADERAMEVVI